MFIFLSHDAQISIVRNTCRPQFTQTHRLSPKQEYLNCHVEMRFPFNRCPNRHYHDEG
jgi:hypothetical protein